MDIVLNTYIGKYIFITVKQIKTKIKIKLN
jgi:hypothetical protein